MYHITPERNLDNVLINGLKINQPPQLTEAGEWALEYYGLNPIYLSRNPWVTKAQTIAWGDEDVEPEEYILLKLDITDLDLVADLPSLVDTGAYIDEEGFWWKRATPPLLAPFVDRDELIYFDDLIVPGHIAEAAIETTQTAACLSDIPANRIKNMGTAF